MAKRVKRAPNLPNITANVRDSLSQVNRVLYQDGVEQNYRLNLALPKDGTEDMEAPLPLQEVATASLPSAALWEGGILYDTTINVPKFSDGSAWKSLFFGQSLGRRTITTTDTVVGTDAGSIIEITSGTFTLSFTAAATLGAGFWTIIYNNGTGDVTLDPNGAEQIDGVASWVLYPGGAILVLCTGTAFESVLLAPMRKQFDSSGTFTKPGVGIMCNVEAWGGGGSGGRGGAADGGGGGGGGAYVPRRMLLSVLGATETVTIGAGGTAVTADNTSGNAGGNTTFGSLLTAFGGGGGNGTNSNPGGGGGGGARSAGTTATDNLGGDGGQPLSFLALDDLSSYVGLGQGSISTDFSGNWNVFGGGGGGIGGLGVNGANGGDAEYGGGGGGGHSDTANGGTGGFSTFGGGGGGGGSGAATGGTGGNSLFGGSGGNGATGNTVAGSGTAPAGGGGGSETGNSGAGAAGRIIVTVW